MGTHGFDVSDRSDQDRKVPTSRRTALGISLGGIMGGLGLLQAEAGKKGKKGKKRKKAKKCKSKKTANVCADQNWCMDRTQTCGAEGGYGKCLVEATGGNVCGEILFQVATCADCDPSACTDCVCVLAAGGGDHCNNGASGYEFICVRPV